jgi:tetratricopeptide (TPR) repeat protein
MGAYGTAVLIKPELIEAHYDFGILLAQRSRFTEAATQFADVTRLAPDFAEGHYLFGVVLMQIPDRRPAAILEYQEALRLNPNFAEAKRGLDFARQTLTLSHLQ